MSCRTKRIGYGKTRGMIAAAVSGVALGIAPASFAQSTGDRVLGLDVSIFQGNISQSTWNNLQSSTGTGDNRQFVIIRSSRGGTTGFDHRAGGYASGNNTQFTASERYDDPNFVQNVARATTAGMFVGPYHLVRPDIIATTVNSDGSTTGVANTGADEADHFIQMAGAWMRPGYIVPMYDFEKGDGIRTDEQLAQFSLDFSNRIYQVMGIRPSIYGSGIYFVDLQNASSSLRNQLAQPAAKGPSVVSPAFTTIVSARYPAGSGNVYNGDIQHENPSDTYSAMYGPWDDYGTAQPWTIWQYSSGGGLNNYSGALDLDVAAGGLEFFKDSLVPAVWMTDTSGDWGTLSNWNSGQTPTQPPVVAGQLTPLATGPLPTPRHPGDAGSGPTSGQNDTVILERPSASITVTLSSGSYDIRKLYVRETLAMTGGSLNVNYVPVAESTPVSAEFSAPVSLSGAAAFSLHTLLIDQTQTFTISGGTFTFNTVYLTNGGAAGGKIQLTGNTTFAPLSGATAQIVGTSSGSAGALDLGAGSRILTVNDGASSIDLDVQVPIQNGTLTKTGAGTMRLSAANSLSGALTITGGTVLLTAANNLSGAISVVTTEPSSGGTIQMSNNISVNLPLTIGGAGSGTATGTAPGSIGALDNLSGTNTWAGAIALNGTGSSAGDAQLNQIGATAGILSLSGVIQNGAGASNWAKTGNGDVVLTGSSPNTFTGMTRVLGGRLIIEKDAALGSGALDTTTTGNTFQLTGSNSTIAFRAPASSPAGFTYSANEWIHLDGNGGGSAGLGQLDNLGGANTFTGKIGLAGTTVSGAMNCSIGVSVGSLELSGGIYARSTSTLPRNITKLGAGTLVISGDSNAAPSNTADASLAASTFNVGVGTVQLKSPSATTTNLPGVTTWNATSTGVLQVASGMLQTTAVSATGGGVISLKSGGGKTLRVSTVAVSGAGSKIDLTDNKMIVDYTSGSPLGVWSGSYNGITGQIATGRASGAWTGAGIVTSMTAALSNPGMITTIGVAEASDALGFTTGTTTWKGQSVDATTVLALYTYAGDANLDGRINADDYFQIDSNYNKPQSAVGYAKGDFNYDGQINGDDYFLIDRNFGMQSSVFQGGAPLGGVSLVPEPTAIGLLALPALAGLRRRRRGIPLQLWRNGKWESVSNLAG